HVPDAKARRHQFANNFTPGKQVHVQPAGASVRWHEEIAAKEVLPQQAPAGARPKVEPAVMDVQDKGATRPDNAIDVVEESAAVRRPLDQAQGAEQASGVVE